MEKLLMSACFLGQKVRYDGGDNRLDYKQISFWQQQQRIVALCPEVAGGLTTPRPAAEIQPQQNISVKTTDGTDVTAAFQLGAQRALAICLANNIHYALLKESSPSCGSNFIYDGTFSGQKIVGAGITSKLLLEHGIQVFSEHNFQQLLQVFPE